MAKFPGSIMGVLFLIAALLVGCGDPSNLPTDTPSGTIDSGTCLSGACEDAGPMADVPSPSEGVSPPTDSGSTPPDVEICYGSERCVGLPCEPSSLLPTCERASSCHCAIPNMEQLCGPGSAPDCRTTMARLTNSQTLTCSPGGANHCSANTDRAWSLFRLHPNLMSQSPRGSDLWNASFSRLHYAFRVEEWTTEEGAGSSSAHRWRWSTGCGFPRSSPVLQEANGFLQICLQDPYGDLGLPEGTAGRMDCAGDLCEWNRRAEVRSVTWSATVTFDEPVNSYYAQYCRATLRVYPPGTDGPSRTIVVRADCRSIENPSQR